MADFTTQQGKASHEEIAGWGWGGRVEGGWGKLHFCKLGKGRRWDNPQRHDKAGQDEGQEEKNP